MPSASDYDQLGGIWMNIRNVSWAAQKIYADYGSGYFDEAIVGATSGLHRWKIAANYLPDAVRTLPQYNSSPWFTYVYEFFKSHTTGGETPFILAWNGKTWTARFSDTSLDLEQFAKGFYSSGIDVQQIKIRGYTSYNSDGSST